jgi:hypothetical protein
MGCFVGIFFPFSFVALLTDTAQTKDNLCDGYKIKHQLRFRVGEELVVVT